MPPILKKPAHNNLLIKIEEAGFRGDELRNFLWLINAHDLLIAFPKVCQNVLRVFELASQNWGYTESDFNLVGISSILKWIVNNKVALNSVSDEFNREPKNNKNHPIVGHGSSKFPLYASLWNSCESPLLQNKYTLLQAHLLFAHASALTEQNNRNEYEVYSGTEAWKGFKNSPYLACLALRELSLESFSANLNILPVEKSPKDFADEIESLPPISSKSALNRINDFVTFIKKSLNIINWLIKNGNSSNGVGGSKSIKGYIELDQNKFIKELQQIHLADPDDPDSSWNIHSNMVAIDLGSETYDKLNNLDLCLDEFDSHELTLSYIDTGIKAGGYAALTAAQVRHVVMANQLLPWSYNQLCLHEIMNLIKVTSSWVSSKVNSEYDESEVKKLEAIFLTRIMIFTASDFERARQLLIFPNDELKGELSLITADFENVKWRIHSIEPDYKTANQINENTQKQKGEYFYLDDLINIRNYLKVLTEKRQWKFPKKDKKDIKNYYLFQRPVPELLKSLKDLLGDIDPTGRLTINKLSKFMFSQLLIQMKGDICAASIIAGVEHPLAHVRMFYSMIPVSKIQKHYFDKVKEIVDLVQKARPVENKLKDIPLTVEQDFYVGSRLCPTFDAVKKAVDKLHNEMQIARRKHDEIRFHNLYTLYTVWQFSFSTACRAIQTPYLHTSEIDKVSGIGTLSDKDNSAGYKTRLIWLSKDIFNAMVQYEQYRFTSSAPKNKELEAYPVFFLKKLNESDERKAEVIKVVNVQPKTLLPVMQEFLNYPANFHRRFMRSELIARSCPMEIVDAWMGHWHTGEEPWATYSSFNFSEYQQALQEYLLPILEDLGFLAKVTLRPRKYNKQSNTNTKLLSRTPKFR